MQTALVTGATGFVGGWLTRRLLADGRSVRILRRKTSSSPELPERDLDVRFGDVSDERAVREACSGVDVVFHLAGLIAHARSQRSAMERVNVQGTRNVVAACAAAGVSKLIHLSSISAVGASFDGLAPLTEDSPYDVGSLNLAYFDSKRASELIVLEAAREGRINGVCLNPGAIYGAGDARKGSRATQLKVARGRMPFYSSGGVNVVAVEDVVEALVAAVERGRSGERYLLGGENLRLREVFAMIAEEAGQKPPRFYLPNALVKALGAIGDWREARGLHGPLTSENAWNAVLFHWLDCSKAKRELGFCARPARQAIASSVAWMREAGLLSTDKA